MRNIVGMTARSVVVAEYGVRDRSPAAIVGATEGTSCYIGAALLDRHSIPLW
jgi:hypothetical protein